MLQLHQYLTWTPSPPTSLSGAISSWGTFAHDFNGIPSFPEHLAQPYWANHRARGRKGRTSLPDYSPRTTTLRAHTAAAWRLKGLIRDYEVVRHRRVSCAGSVNLRLRTDLGKLSSSCSWDSPVSRRRHAGDRADYSFERTGPSFEFSRGEATPRGLTGSAPLVRSSNSVDSASAARMAQWALTPKWRRADRRLSKQSL
ncbi:hypothetical protein C8R44DRAFT_870837 [Mycena epipterygia]|nr:hypothetical protein C8R44DRAFT_870837 [Mycena epipterygia]